MRSTVTWWAAVAAVGAAVGCRSPTPSPTPTPTPTPTPSPTPTPMPRPSITVVDAPSNLGLRPPAPGVEPGVKGLAAALRGHGLVSRLGARDGGVVAPPPYS